ncbi:MULTISPECIES: ABC transporter ATP-binding protein [unclassified Butyrivibrio]|uniref:ABC transporter ATP-binding protein n=1 Tax=unclassified Butyrivibrio TaxID=2639466 RepID=UPI0003B3A35B|nr:MULTISPECIES: ABC transporter ATP-binding protein [unclassified Butyrivibrio]MDC7293368.1 ABC transporter ATP-binding protein [Butyrivibrio sp. DSM 10294]
MKIVLEHLTKRFPNRNKKIRDEVVAVNDFDFTIPDGKLIGLLGPSGCGKSTALNLICGLEKPTEGKIYFGDLDVTALAPEKRGVGLVFQNYALYPHLSVRENIRFPLENLRGDKKLTKQQMEEKVLEAAKLVQIEELLDRKPNEMSGGQQQRVAIARALVKRPQVLLLDEPLSNLDARLRLQTREELKRIQLETGITTVFVTHDQEEAMSISDTIVVMKDGVLQQMGKPQDIYDDPINLFVAKFLGTPQINVFTGEVIGEKVYIDKAQVCDAPGVRDGDVYVAVRPEGFVVDPSGPLICEFIGREVMGRDTSVIARHGNFLGENIRAIIPSEELIDSKDGSVRFALKPSKVRLFDKGSEERIRVEA